MLHDFSILLIRLLNNECFFCWNSLHDLFFYFFYVCFVLWIHLFLIIVTESLIFWLYLLNLSFAATHNPLYFRLQSFKRVLRDLLKFFVFPFGFSFLLVSSPYLFLFSELLLIVFFYFFWVNLQSLFSFKNLFIPIDQFLFLIRQFLYHLEVVLTPFFLHPRLLVFLILHSHS
jgi:hypothetical protein